jgi:membrane protein implicated in regulation of membrane protease activity
VSERPRPLLWTLLGCAVLAATLVAAGLVLLAGSVASQTAALIGTVSECAWLLAVTRTLPLGLLLPALLGVASAVAFVRSVRGYQREQRLLGALPLEPIAEGELGEVARTSGFAIYRTPAARPAAFCFGLFRPRIVFTSGLVERLSATEQAAAFWHEAQHARLREPLRCLLARLAASTFFWLPMLRDLFDRYTLVRELDADRLAARRTSTGALAGALHEVITGPRVAGAVGFADFAAARVDRLLDPAVPLPSLFTRTRLALSIGAVALLGVAFTYPANVPVSTHVHSQAMMMKVPVLTSAGVRWTLVPCM